MERSSSLFQDKFVTTPDDDWYCFANVLNTRNLDKFKKCILNQNNSLDYQLPSRLWRYRWGQIQLDQQLPYIRARNDPDWRWVGNSMSRIQHKISTYLINHEFLSCTLVMNSMSSLSISLTTMIFILSKKWIANSLTASLSKLEWIFKTM